MSKTLVIGASGTVGSELVRLLEARGDTVLRATSRPVSESGQVRIDLVTGTGLAAALDKVDRAFLLAPPGHTNQDALLNPVIDQAAAHGIEKLVLMTAMGADADDAAPMRKAELHLIGSGLTHVIIRPNWFMQNFNTFWIRSILDHGKIMLPVGRAKGSFIDARDISAVAAQLLSSSDFDGRAFDLTGPEALDHDEVASILSRETGRDIAFQDIEPQAMLAGLIEAGLPRDYAEFLLVILGYFKSGYAERTTGAVKEITGTDPRSLETYAKDHRAFWLA